jgi:hypothetical protein
MPVETVVSPTPDNSTGTTVIFDHTAITEVSWESAQHLHSEIMNMTGRRKNFVKHALVDAEVVLDEKNILTINDILLDTGATLASYIDKDLVDKHREVWRDRIRTMHAVVKFGDNKTSQEINEIVVLPLRMQYQTLTHITADIEFCVMQMPGRTMISQTSLNIISTYCWRYYTRRDKMVKITTGASKYCPE